MIYLPTRAIYPPDGDPPSEAWGFGGGLEPGFAKPRKAVTRYMSRRQDKGAPEEGGRQFLLRLDEDTAEALKGVPTGGKAAFVNAALRQAFRNREVLEAVDRLREDLAAWTGAGNGGPSPEAFAEAVLSKLPVQALGDVKHAVDELREELADVRAIVSAVQDQAGATLARFADSPRLARQADDLRRLAAGPCSADDAPRTPPPDPAHREPPPTAPAPPPAAAEEAAAAPSQVQPETGRQPLRLPGLG